jgi:molybdenum cofactor cytidylyltransferase
MVGKVVHAILLAAGVSARMGRDKLLMEIEGKTVFEIALGNHLGSSLAGVCAVVPAWISGFGEIVRRNVGPRTTFVEMDQPCEMSESLKTGWRWVRENTDARGVMISLADQPLVRAGTIDLLIQTFLSSSKPCCVPAYRGRHGHPVVFSPGFDRDIMKLEGDRGARRVLAGRPDLVLEVEVDSDEVLLDLDRIEDFRSLQSRFRADG